MNYRVPRIVEKTLENYSVESKIELEELSKLNLMVSNGNIPMIKIIDDVNGFETLKTRDFTKYIVHVGSPFDGVFDCE